MGGTTTKVAIGILNPGSNGSLDIEESGALPTNAGAGPDSMIAAIASYLSRLAHGVRLDGVGLTLPSAIDPDSGGPLFAPALGPAWICVPVGRQLHNLVGCRVVTLNDVQSMAAAEQWQGAGRGAANVVYVGLGTGVGGAVVIDGVMRPGVDGTAGGIGHTTVNPTGPSCPCGNRGCLEQYAAAAVIATAAGQPDAQAAAAAARGGDTRAQAAYDVAGKWIGLAIANVIDMLTPERVIVGGGLSGAGDLLLDPIRQEVRDRVRVASMRSTTILAGTLGVGAGAIGAALAVAGHGPFAGQRLWRQE